MKYKMVVTDFDDTLLKSDRTVDKETINTIHKYVEKGGKFTIATGRMVTGVLPFCKKNQLKGELICFQGGVIIDIESEEILSKTTINNLDLIEIAKYLESKKEYFQIYKGDNFIVKRRNLYSKLYGSLCNSKALSAKKKLSVYIEENGLDSVKIVVITSFKKVAGLIKEISEKFGDKVLANTSKKWMVEIVPKATNKGLAIKQVAEKYQINSEEIIAIGDSLNDVTMLEAAGLGVVVENGSEIAKSYADIIVPSNDKDGVGFVINNYCLKDE